MASSTTTTVSQIPPRIPVPKTRLPVHQQPQSQSTTVILRPKNVTPSIVISNNHTGNIKFNIYIYIIQSILIGLSYLCFPYVYIIDISRIFLGLQ